MVIPSATDFATRKCRLPSAATCGEWVTTSTCAPSASRASRRPTASAVAPPTPRSISSKIITSVSLPRARLTLSASRNRDSSPPDAIRSSGPDGAPGFVATVKATVSRPSGPGSPSLSRVSNTARSIFSGASSAAIDWSSRPAASVRAAVTAAAAAS